MPINLPTALLRSFVAIVDTGSMLNASEQVFVTQSALSLQIKRLEETMQLALFRREGRRLVLTPAGDLMLGYARRILDLHDEALVAVSGNRFAGPVRVGIVQDFADTALGGLLARFAELHPDAQIYARVAGTDDLRDLLQRSQLDLILGFGPADDPHALRVAPMDWFGAEGLLDQKVLPLAVLEKPCRFRAAALAALDAAGIAYRIAIETPNLSSLRAAVQAGLGITVRTRLFLDDLELLPRRRLPQLPPVACVMELGGQPGAAVLHLAALTEERVAAPRIPADIAPAQASAA